jgi:hypothetical protein
MDGKVGVFPLSHTTRHVRDVSVDAGRVVGGEETIARALFDFMGGQHGDLAFRKNDVIEVAREVNSDWLEGRLDGMTGIFPKSFVRIERRQIESNSSISKGQIPDSKVNFQNPSSQPVVLREKKKPVPRPRTVIISKTSSGEARTHLRVAKDDMALDHTQQLRCVTASVPKPAPRPRHSLQPAVDTGKASIGRLSVDFDHLANGFDKMGPGAGRDKRLMVNCILNEGKSHPVGHVKPRSAVKPPISPKPSVKPRRNQQGFFNVDTKPGGGKLAVPVIRPRSAPSCSRSDCPVVIKAATLCEDEGSDSPPVLVQKEDRQFLSPFQEKHDSLSSHDSGIGIPDIDQKIQETKDRLRLEMMMSQTIETTLKHVTTSESPTLQLKMEKCKDSVRLLKVQLQELEIMKEEEDLNAKVVFESSHVVTNLNGIGEDVWSWSKENSSFINRKDNESLPSTSDNGKCNCDEAIDMDGGSRENSLSPIDPAVKQARNRIKVIDEIITTEERYIADLTVACEKIRRPLKQQQIDGLDIDTLFGNMEEVAEVSRDFLSCLIQHQQEDRLGECFLKKGDQLKEVYSKYSCRHDKALALLDKFDYIPAARQAIMACVQSAKSELSCWPLSALLIKPVQRILKYPLLLNELLKVCRQTDDKWN